MFKHLALGLFFLSAPAAFADNPPLAGNEVIRTVGSPRNTLLVSEIASFVLGDPRIPLTVGDYTGATDSAAAIAAAVTSTNASGIELFFGAGTLKLGSDVFLGPATVGANNLSNSTPLAQRIQLSPMLTQTGAGLLKFQHLFPSGPGNIFTLDYLGKAYDSSYNGYDNIYQQGVVAQQNGTTTPVVAFAPWGVLNSDSASVWGMNNACFVTFNGGDTKVCYGQETDVGTVVAGAHTYGIDVHGFGTFANYIGYRLTANGPSSGFNYGFVLNATSWTPVSGTLFLISGSNYSSATGFDISQGAFTAQEWTSPTLIMGPTVTANGGWNGATGARAGLLASSVASGLPTPTLYAAVGAGNVTGSNLGLLATTGASVLLQTGALASPATQFSVSDTASTTSWLNVTGSNGTAGPTLSAGGNGAAINVSTLMQTAAARIGFSGNTNYIQIVGAGTGSAPVIAARGDANAAVTIASNGTGNIAFNSGTNGTQFFIVDNGATVASRIAVTGSATGVNPRFFVSGTAANIVFGSGAALTTGATTGFPAIPTIAGIPTGITGAAGQAAIMINTSSHKLCHSEGGGTWFDATGAACS